MLVSVLGLSGSAQTIRIYNLAHLNPADLYSAARNTVEIFGRAGVHIDWTQGDPEDLEAHSLDLIVCSLAPVHDEIRLRIIEKAPPGFQRTALGFALPCARFGAHATIFADRVMAVSEHLGVPFSTALGHGMAHELGHVLLRTEGHTSTGIMRAKWDGRDWQNAATFGLVFDEKQSASLRGGQ